MHRSLDDRSVVTPVRRVPHRRTFVALMGVAVAVLAGCATVPQPPIALDGDLSTLKTARVGVAMTALPKVDTEFPGAGCLLCYAAASAAHQTLTRHVQTLPSDDVAQLRPQLVGLLKARGIRAVEIDTPIVLKDLPSASQGQGSGGAPRDFTALKDKFGVDKLLLIDVRTLGVWRSFASYVPTAEPRAVFQAVGYVVNLGTNTLDWYQVSQVGRSAGQNWDEPPKFPGLTNAYFQAVEVGKDALTRPFAKQP